MLGLEDAAGLLNEALQEESQTEEDLTAIGAATVNAEAMQQAA